MPTLFLAFLLLAQAPPEEIVWEAFPKSDEDIEIFYDTEVYEEPTIVGDGLGGINTATWEDSPEISWDGRTLTFLWMALDLGAFTQENVIRRGPIRRQYQVRGELSLTRSDILQATRISGASPPRWTIVPFPEIINHRGASEGSASLNPTRLKLVFARSDEDDDDNPRRALYLATRPQAASNRFWTAPTMLPVGPVNEANLQTNTANDPFLLANKLYFDRQTPGGSVDIYHVPFPVPPGATPTLFTELNDAEDRDTQLWASPDDQQFLFCREFQAIYYWSRQAGGAPTAIVGSASGNALGEPSMTENGDLYFLYVFSHAIEDPPITIYDADVVLLKRK
jgi:hypothetical protein